MEESKVYTTFKQFNTLQGMFQFHVCYNKTFHKFKIKKHQLNAMFQANGDFGYYYKHIDLPRHVGNLARLNKQNQFHSLYLINIPTYIVLAWCVPNQFLEYHYIKPEDWVVGVETVPKVVRYNKSKKMATFLYKCIDRRSRYPEEKDKLIVLK